MKDIQKEKHIILEQDVIKSAMQKSTEEKEDGNCETSCSLYQDKPEVRKHMIIATLKT